MRDRGTRADVAHVPKPTRGAPSGYAPSQAHRNESHSRLKPLPRHDGLIFDWNLAEGDLPAPALPLVLDETLRDGLQSPSASDPPVHVKLELLHEMAKLGIHCAAIGMPACRPRQYEDSLILAREAAREKLSMRVLCTARTLVADVVPIVEIAQKTGAALEVGMFVGSSPIRHYTEGWALDEVLRHSEESIAFAVKHGLEVLYVTEDTTRTPPDSLAQLYRAAIRSGASRLCVADTAGHATPVGAASVVRFVRRVIEDAGAALPIDWHGHRDRGMELGNCLAAWSAGAQRCHGTALGIGERSGNAPLELLLVNLQLNGWTHQDLSSLPSYIERAAHALGFEVPPHHPIVGADAFRTATGVHAAAVAKAAARGDSWLVDHVYSSVPASSLGREQVLEVGPFSGEANVRHFLRQHGFDGEPALVRHVLGIAKGSDNVLAETELLDIVRGFGSRASVTG